MPVYIHPSAVVSPRAEVGEDAYVGPFCTVGDDVRLGARVRLESHVVVDGRTELGDDTQVFPFASVGLAPQDLKYRGEPSETRIGRRCHLREFVTIHRGTEGGGLLTSIGDDCLIMAQAHVAHDCRLGNRVIMANAATLAGHVERTAQTSAHTPAYTSSAASVARHTSAATPSSSKTRSRLRSPSATTRSATA
jgi:UDP-N-acetylglucosamine acyltransferase